MDTQTDMPLKERQKMTLTKQTGDINQVPPSRTLARPSTGQAKQSYVTAELIIQEES